MKTRAFHRLRVLKVAAVGAGVLALGGLTVASGVAPSTSDSSSTRAERPSGALSTSSVVQEHPARDAETTQPRRSQNEALVSVATAAVSVARPASEHAAQPVRSYESPAAELQDLEGRLRGENLTLENRTRSLENVRRLLAGELTADARSELERRALVLEAKQRAQAKRLSGLEQRVAELRRL